MTATAMEPTAVSELVAATAAELRLEPARIHTTTLDLNRLREHGVLLQVRVFGTSSLWRKPIWEEMGVDKEDIRLKRFTPGVAALFDRELVSALESTESKFRQALERYSYDVNGFRPYRLVLKGRGSYDNPAESPYWTFRRRYDELLLEWEERVNNLLNEEAYREALEKASQDWTRIAREEAHPALLGRVRKRTASWTPALRQVALDELGDADAFCERVVRHAIERFPTVAELRRVLRVELDANLLLNPEEIERMLQERDQARAQREIVELDLLNQFVVRSLDEVRPFDSVLNEAPARIYHEAEEAFAAIERNGYLPGQTKNKLRRLKAEYLLMSLGRDAALEAALDELLAALALAGGRNVEVALALNGVKRATYQAACVMAELRPDVWRMPREEPADEQEG